jgi:hypothetical protein
MSRVITAQDSKAFSDATGLGKLQTTPVGITPPILAFCESITPELEPLFLNVPPLTSGNQHMLSEAHFNVREHTKREGCGSIQYGWVIWEQPNVLLEAEFHSVWKAPNGELIDITPQMDGEKQVLFLADPVRTFNFQTREYVPSKRWALQNDADLRRYFEILDASDKEGRHKSTDRDSLMRRIEGQRLLAEVTIRYGNEETGRNLLRMADAARDFYKAQFDMVEGVDRDQAMTDAAHETVASMRRIHDHMNDLHGKALCPCGSGKSYKTCCRKTGKRYNTDGTAKLSSSVPHHQATIPGEELFEHWEHVAEEHRTEQNLKFNRFHFKDHDEAVLFVKALHEEGGFGTVVNQSVRVVNYWRKLAESLLPHFETGPVELSACDTPYEEPHVDFRLDGEIPLEKPKNGRFQ